MSDISAESSRSSTVPAILDGLATAFRESEGVLVESGVARFCAAEIEYISRMYSQAPETVISAEETAAIVEAAVLR